MYSVHDDWLTDLAPAFAGLRYDIWRKICSPCWSHCVPRSQSFLSLVKSLEEKNNNHNLFPQSDDLARFCGAFVQVLVLCVCVWVSVSRIDIPFHTERKQRRFNMHVTRSVNIVWPFLLLRNSTCRQATQHYEFHLIDFFHLWIEETFSETFFPREPHVHYLQLLAELSLCLIRSCLFGI